MSLNRIKFRKLQNKVASVEEAVMLIKNNMTVGSSGFTRAGDSKAVLPAIAKRAANEELKINLITGASLGQDTDGHLAENHALLKRLPFQVDPVMRKAINKGEFYFIDQHLSETAELLQNGHLPRIDVAVIEAAFITEDGGIVPTTSVGNSCTFAEQAETVIVEINTSVGEDVYGIHDICLSGKYPNKRPFLVNKVDDRIGQQAIYIPTEKIKAIVFTDIPDSPAAIAPPDEKTTAISEHILNFLKKEVAAGHLPKNLLPLQAGIGKVANAVLTGFINSDFENLVMYSEVLQDSTFDLIDSGKMTFASASSITVSEECFNRVFSNISKYKDKIVLRPQNISNAAEIIRRLGIIGLNTAIEFDIYGNVNSTHTGGINMMNGIGGSGDFARNAYLSIFVAQAASKNNTISHVVPMVSHHDHTEHDVDIIVTDQGLADLRGLAPRERAQVIIDKCVHPDYKAQMQDYFDRAKERGGHTPHLIEEALSWHTRLAQTGSMKKQQ
ncbi:MAG: succinate CoA transferase [Flavobacteriaceae bacterium]|jgi:acetyl-CoA hydrolase/succinyl-CoA:acetate CoA-transferase|nr:succinate CoA transferase [Flavobacteriaceae bacterium]